MTLSDQMHTENLHIETLTKDLMRKYLPDILLEAEGFRFLNWDEENYLKDLPDKWKYSIAVIVNQAICGFSVNSNKSGLFYIHFFYIFKNFRKMGLGKYLLTACENICREENRKAVQLKCLKNNEAAMSFYERNGFKIIDIEEKKDIYYIMQKKL